MGTDNKAKKIVMMIVQAGYKKRADLIYVGYVYEQLTRTKGGRKEVCN